ncbi:MAG: cation diffusion facilitator family transporter [Lachnospiraceae bacterium]|nr:cation diffusion facilitator family transporter [Lachnospiraceae bacterium]
MITLLSRLFIPDHEKTDLPEVRRRYGVLSGTVGIFLNLILFAGKLSAGLFVRSVAITADAFNNLSDAASSVITLIGFKLAGKRADRDHPFGHGRVEYIAGLLISISIILVGADLTKSSLDRIISPVQAVYSGAAAVVLTASIAVKLYMFLYNRNLAERIGSVALRSTAMDSISDCAATSAVLICQLLSAKFGLHLDGLCGLAVSLFILHTGIRSAFDTISPLLGQAPDAELTAKIEEIVLHTEGILDMHDLMIHDYGPGHQVVSLHAEIPSDFSLVHAHEIIDRLETKLDRELGVMSVIHMDPVDSKDHQAHLLRSRVLKKLRSMDPEAGLHDFRILRGDDMPAVSFDAQFPFSYKETDESILLDLSDYISRELPGYQAIIRVDRE